MTDELLVSHSRTERYWTSLNDAWLEGHFSSGAGAVVGDDARALLDRNLPHAHHALDCVFAEQTDQFSLNVTDCAEMNLYVCQYSAGGECSKNVDLCVAMSRACRTFALKEVHKGPNSRIARFQHRFVTSPFNFACRPSDSSRRNHVCKTSHHQPCHHGA